MRRFPPLNSLRAFEAAARHLSFKDAAQELAVTPAAISQQVKQLEATIGQNLFIRQANGLQITLTGQRYANALGNGFDRIAQASLMLQEEGPRGPLKVSVLPSFAALWLAPRLGDFQKRYPEITLHIFPESQNSDFNAGEADIGIRFGLGDYPGLKIWRLMTDMVYPVCAPSLLNGPNGLRRPADLLTHTLLHDSDTTISEPWLQWSSWLRLLDVPEQQGTQLEMMFHGAAPMVQACLSGVGVALARQTLIHEFLNDGRLVTLFGVSRMADYVYYIVTAESRAEDPAITVFVEWLMEQAARS